jgi:hypothetical protein
MWRRSAERDAGTVAEASSYDPASSSVPGNRGPIGVIALAVALFTAAIVPAVLDHDVRGVASAAPLPEPPPIGSCVDFPADGPPAVVSCDGLHDGEVTMSWAAGEFPTSNEGTEPRSYTAVIGGASRFTYFECFGWNSSYVGGLAFSAYFSAPAMLFSGGMVYGSPGQRYDRLYWSACAITPPVATAEYSGSIRSAGAHPTTARPDVFTGCLGAPVSGATELAFTSCQLPHRVEPIAMDPDPDSPLPADHALAMCQELVREVTGASDPTYGGLLDIKVQPVLPRTMTQEEYASADLGAQDCVVELAGPGDMVGSVVAHGDAPLAVTG